MIKLYQFPQVGWNLPSASPFCMKMEMYLKANNIPYESVYTNEVDKTPKGKFPYIEDDGKIIADSSFIIEYLEKNFPIKLEDKSLSKKDAAILHAFSKMIEESLYWVMVYARWVDNWPITKEAYFKGCLPDEVCEQIKSDMLAEMHGHGMGRHSRDEIYHIGKKILRALSDFLDGDKYFCKYFTTLDIIAYSFLANIYEAPIKSPLKDEFLKCDNLVEYLKRIKNRIG